MSDEAVVAWHQDENWQGIWLNVNSKRDMEIEVDTEIESDMDTVWAYQV